MKDFYATLSVPRDASPREIKKRFLVLARERHPDRFSGEEKARAEEEFQAITEAFNVLSDPTRRRQHDVELDKPQRRGHDPGQLTKHYMARGVRAYKQENWIEAADNFRRATEADGKNPQAWHHLALTCLQQERWLPQGREAIDRALELAPEKAAYLKLAGKLYAASGMTARAKEYYNRALQHGGPDATVRKALEALQGPAQPEEGERKERQGLFKKLF